MLGVKLKDSKVYSRTSMDGDEIFYRFTSNKGEFEDVLRGRFADGKDIGNGYIYWGKASYYWWDSHPGEEYSTHVLNGMVLKRNGDTGVSYLYVVDS